VPCELRENDYHFSLRAAGACTVSVLREMRKVEKTVPGVDLNLG